MAAQQGMAQQGMAASQSALFAPLPAPLFSSGSANIKLYLAHSRTGKKNRHATLCGKQFPELLLRNNPPDDVPHIVGHQNSP